MTNLTMEELLARDGKLVYRTRGVSMEPMLRQDRDRSREQAKDPEPKEETDRTKAASFDAGAFFRQTIGRIRAFFGGVIRSIWYGAEEKEDAPGSGRETVKKDPAAPEADRYSDERIRALLAKKDEAGFMEALTQGHTRMPARNTSLLTYYDRRGQIVGPSPTDSVRILRGDGSGKDTIRRPQGNYRRFI